MAIKRPVRRDKTVLIRIANRDAVSSAVGDEPPCSKVTADASSLSVDLGLGFEQRLAAHGKSRKAEHLSWTTRMTAMRWRKRMAGRDERMPRAARRHLPRDESTRIDREKRRTHLDYDANELILSYSSLYLMY